MPIVMALSAILKVGQWRLPIVRNFEVWSLWFIWNLVIVQPLRLEDRKKLWSINFYKKKKILLPKKLHIRHQ